MVSSDTPPSTPLNLSEMMGDELDLDEFDDLEEITFDDLEQLSDDSGDDEQDQSVQVDDASVTFNEHEGSIFCCHLDPRDGRTAVTGGEDEKVYFWNTEGGEVIYEGTGFKDSVIGVEFSHDGKYVAAGDMGGLIKVWKYLPPNPPQEIWTETTEEINWIKWHHKFNILLCGVFTGEIFMWKIQSGECKVLIGHGVSSDSGLFLPDGKRAVIGYRDGIIKVFDLSSSNAVHTINTPELDGILCLAIHPDNNLVAAGTIHTKVVIFSSQTGKVSSLFSCKEYQQETENEEFRESVETIAFSKEPSLPLLAVGTTCLVVIWDFSKQVIRNKVSIVEGVTKLLWDLQGPLIYFGTPEGDVKVMDVRSSAVETTLHGHKAAILDMAFSKDGKKLITSSDDKTAKIFTVGPVPST